MTFCPVVRSERRRLAHARRDLPKGRAGPGGSVSWARLLLDLLRVLQTNTRKDGLCDACASRALERERLPQRGGKLRIKARAQQPACAMEARLHRLRKYAEVFGGLVDAHLLDVAHHEHDAEGVRKIVDRALKQPADLGPRRRALWITRSVHTWEHDHARISAQQGLVDCL